MVAILQLITLLLLLFAETMFSEHDIYVEARDKSAGAGDKELYANDGAGAGSQGTTAAGEGELELGGTGSDTYEAPVMDVQEIENPSADTI